VKSEFTFCQVHYQEPTIKPQTTAQDILLHDYTTGKIGFWIAIELGCHWRCSFELTGTITQHNFGISIHDTIYITVI